MLRFTGENSVKSVVVNAINRVKQESAVPQRKLSKDEVGQDDQVLLDILEENKARICVIGVGGGGGNTINRMSEIGIEGAETYAVNTDAQDLLKIKADRKVLIGKKLTRGLGAGSDPSVGEASAEESEEDLYELLGDSDLVFITCGLGGGTGTGSAPVVAKLVKEKKCLTIGVVTL